MINGWISYFQVMVLLCMTMVATRAPYPCQAHLWDTCELQFALFETFRFISRVQAWPIIGLCHSFFTCSVDLWRWIKVSYMAYDRQSNDYETSYVLYIYLLPIRSIAYHRKNTYHHVNHAALCFLLMALKVPSWPLQIFFVLPALKPCCLTSCR